MGHELSGDAVLREQQFHDEWAESIDVSDLLVEESFTSPTAFENSYCLEEMGPLDGKKILDLGCGAGEAAVYFAMQGATVCGVDVSPKMLTVVQKLAETRDVQVRTVLAGAEDLPFEDESFDLVYGNGVLHHVDKAAALREVNRILNSSGTAVFIEPLAYNPLIKAYRKIAQNIRTVDETPLRYRDLRLFESLFHSVKHREMWFLSLYIFLWFYLIERAHPSKVRYWKKVINDGHKHRRGIALCKVLDAIALKVFPFLRFWCWNSVITVRKQKI